MKSLIPARRAELLRNYEHALFYQKEQPQHERLYAFYLLVRPLFDQLKEDLLLEGLEPDEVESELFILAADIFKGFEPEKSSVIPYLSKALIWKTGHLLRRLEKSSLGETPGGLLKSSRPYRLSNEVYLKSPDILFEDKYLGKCFTKGQKYLISIILTADDKLEKSELANKAGICKENLRNRLSEIKSILEHGGYDDRSSQRI